MGVASVPLRAQSLIALELATVLIDAFVDTHGLVRKDLIGRPPGRMQVRGLRDSPMA